ncbi:MAG: LysE family translocator [Muribaculaceae bacterium]|nr:LysE family translocator [Muribaculaceae bacterium]
MENLIYILPRGLAIGALISAPMGPIGMLIIQRTLSKGRWPAFFTGIGAALSDLLYCLLAGFGLSFITDIIERHQFALQVFGSVVLAAFGLYLFRKNPTRSLKAAQVDSRSYWSDFISGFFLTFSNPLILFFIIGLFARFNFILPEFEIFHYIWAYLTIFGGALLWWYFVTFLVSKLRSRFNVRSLWLVNRIVGSILIAMAIIGVLLAVNEHALN